jgi:hypothetical protein
MNLFTSKTEPFELNVYPNPANNQTNIGYTFTKGNNGLRITDVNGREIFSRYELDEHGLIRIKTAEWNAGMYFIQVLHEGSSIGRSRLVIVR